MANSKPPTTSEADYELRTTKAKLLSRGAEAKIYLTPKKQILKTRTPKTYRHPTLDKKLRTRRTKSEAKNLLRASQAKVNVPQVLNQEKFDLTIEYLPGERLSQTLNQKPTKQQISIIKKLGTQIAKLHKANIIHSDLTTSNTILLQIPNPKSQIPREKVYLIGFGLSYISTKTEDKAVDLHLLKKALQAKHHKTAKTLFQNFLKTYKNKEVIARLKIVENRGRYKH